MAHFAELDENNIVLRVVVIDDFYASSGEQYCHDLFGGNWKQTSYNGNIRKQYAGVGYTYDETLDAFIPPKPFNSWILDVESCIWQSPTPIPNDGALYFWDESTLSWFLKG